MGDTVTAFDFLCVPAPPQKTALKPMCSCDACSTVFPIDNDMLSPVNCTVRIYGGSLQINIICPGCKAAEEINEFTFGIHILRQEQVWCKELLAREATEAQIRHVIAGGPNEDGVAPVFCLNCNKWFAINTLSNTHCSKADNGELTTVCPKCNAQDLFNNERETIRARLARFIQEILKIEDVIQAVKARKPDYKLP